MNILQMVMIKVKLFLWYDSYEWLTVKIYIDNIIDNISLYEFIEQCPNTFVGMI